jgi:cysteine synthase
LARRAPEPEVQVTEKEVKSFEATKLGLAGEVISVGLDETRGRIVCEATVVNGSATTKFVIDPASGESNSASHRRGTARSGVEHARSTPEWFVCTRRAASQIAAVATALRSAIGIASLDHAIFPKISLDHRNFFRCRIAP